MLRENNEKRNTRPSNQAFCNEYSIFGDPQHRNICYQHWKEQVISGTARNLACLRDIVQLGCDTLSLLIFESAEPTGIQHNLFDSSRQQFTMKLSSIVQFTFLTAPMKLVASQNIAEVAGSLPNFSTLVELVTIESEALNPVLNRLTGDTPTSESILILDTVRQI